MIELAAPCVEPATLLFLRRIEPPIRSQRVLGPSFWKNGGDSINAPPWWPLYLTSVRQIPQFRSTKEPIAAVAVEKYASKHTKEGSGAKRSAEKYKRKLHSARHALDEKRFYSVPAVASHEDEDDVLPPSFSTISSKEQPSPSLVNEDRQGSEYDPTEMADRAISPPNKVYPHKNTESQRKTLLESLLARPSPHTKSQNLSNTWLLFISLPDQETHASAMLAYLAQSNEAVHLDRAVQAYSIIPIESRSRSDYNNGASVARRRRRYNLAIDICTEAQGKGVGQECRQRFLLHCMENAMWQMTARVWRTLFDDLSKELSGLNTVKDENWNIVDSTVSVPNTLYAMLRHLSDSQNARLVETIKPALREVGAAFLWRILISARIMDLITPQGIMQLFEHARDVGELLSDHYFRAIQTLCSQRIRRNRADLAIMLYRKLRFIFPETRVPTATLAGLVGLCGKAAYPAATFHYLLGEYRSFQQRPSVQLSEQVMSIYSRRGDVASVETMLQTLKTSPGFSIRINHYNSLLHAYAMRGDVEGAKSVFQKLQQEYGVSPDVVSWNILLNAFARSSKPHEAFAAFDQMKSAGIQPDVRTFGTLIGVASNAGDTDRVVRLIDLARAQQIPESDQLTASLVHSRCLNGEVEAAEDLVQTISKIHPERAQIRSWNTLLRHFAFQADHRALHRILNSMKAHDAQPDDMTFAAIMTALVRVQQTSQALQVLRALHFDQNLIATSFHYSIVLHGFSMEGNKEMVAIMSKEIKERFPHDDSGLQSAKAMEEYRQTLVRAKDSSQAAVKSPSRPSLDETVEVASDTFESGSKLWMNHPQPGSRRRSSTDPLSTRLALELLAKFSIGNLDLQKASNLIKQLEAVEEQRRSSNHHEQADVVLLTLKMAVAARTRQWDKVESLWSRILWQAVKMSVPLEQRERIAVQVDQLLKASSAQFITRLLDQLETDDTKVLPAHRFKLSVPLNTYMLALEARGMMQEIDCLPRDIEKLGFAFSGKNWNAFVHTMCRSSQLEHQRKAIETFDQVLRPNAPNIKFITRGQWVEPSIPKILQPLKKVPRKLIESTRPELATPTYFTVVHMAMVISAMKTQADDTGSDVLRSLRQAHPDTFRLIERLPYLQDKVQRLLLRRRNIFGDVGPSPAESNWVDRSGVASGRSEQIQTSGEQTQDWKDLLSDQTGGESVGIQKRLVRTFDEDTGEFGELNLVATESSGDPVLHSTRQQLAILAGGQGTGHVQTNKLLTDSQDHTETNILLQPDQPPMQDKPPESVEAEVQERLEVEADGTERSPAAQDKKGWLVSPARTAYLTRQLLPPKSKRRQRSFTKVRERQRLARHSRVIQRRPIEAAKRLKRQAALERQGPLIAARLDIPIPRVEGQAQVEAWTQITQRALRELKARGAREEKMPF